MQWTMLKLMQVIVLVAVLLVTAVTGGWLVSNAFVDRWQERFDLNEPFVWDLPTWLPPPALPDSETMTNARVALGRHLFYDKRLSRDDTMSCATCHEQLKAFTDSRQLSPGITGEVGTRNTPGLANVGYSPSLTWANPHMTTLERHVLTPLFGEEPVEMGLSGYEKTVFAKLSGDERYRHLFPSLIPKAPAKSTCTLLPVPSVHFSGH